MKFITLAKTILALLPAIVAAIRAVEEAIPGEGKGEAKLALIREILEKVYASTQDLTVEFERLWPAISTAISAVVSALNATGWKSNDA